MRQTVFGKCTVVNSLLLIPYTRNRTVDEEPLSMYDTYPLGLRNYLLDDRDDTNYCISTGKHFSNLYSFIISFPGPLSNRRRLDFDHTDIL